MKRLPSSPVAVCSMTTSPLSEIIPFDSRPSCFAKLLWFMRPIWLVWFNHTNESNHLPIVLHQSRFRSNGLLPSVHRVCVLSSSKDYKEICWNRVEARRLVARSQSIMKMEERADRKESSRCPSWATTLSA